ncbi:MAG: cell division protein ZapA [Defluviitaleaceae bacterium]|nr:cell division protein ZapA [Defluviitaleaceae bacterium]
MEHVDVVFDGKIITLKSKESREYLQKLAFYIDRKIDEIKASNLASTDNDYLRIAFNVADDYHREQEELRRLKSVHQRFVLEMGKMQEELSKKANELNKCKKMIAKLEAELAELKQK